MLARTPRARAATRALLDTAFSGLPLAKTSMWEAPRETSPFVSVQLRNTHPVFEAWRVWNKTHAGPMPRAYVEAYCRLEGFHQFKAAKSANSNPYPADLITHAWWAEGFNARGGAL